MDKHKLKVVYINLLIVIGLLNLNISFANDNEIQSKCFDTLKQNLSEIGSFATPYKEIKNMQYSNLENNFSRYYKNISSFGIDLDEPLFEMRLYSFGKQTGYVHPPYSPFAVGTKSEKWDKAAKEFIIAEEYITKPDGTKQFISCSFMQMSAKDLMNIKAENYWYDGEIISLVKKDANLDYKAWYNENVSYDFNNSPFVTWNRLFIYPKETENTYFDRYKIAENFPTNIAKNFNSLKINKIVSKNSGDGSPRIYMTDENGNITNSNAPRELKPIKNDGNNKIFTLYNYYQEIENIFPEFSKHIALRGEVHFDFLKVLIGDKDNLEYSHLWNTLLDSRGITKYSLAKKNGQINNISDGEKEYYEKNIPLIGNYENNVLEIIKNSKDKKVSNINKDNSKYRNLNYIYILAILLLITSLITILVIKKKRKK